MNKSFLLVVIILGIIWLTFIGFYIRYAEVLKGNPIAFGARRFGVDCICTSPRLPGAVMMVNRTGNVTYSYPDRPDGVLDFDSIDWKKLIKE